jgi:hypothetical protein
MRAVIIALMLAGTGIADIKVLRAEKVLALRIPTVLDCHTWLRQKEGVRTSNCCRINLSESE